MSTPSRPLLANRPRVVAIVVASFIGFLAGQILALTFDLVGALVTHYPGGLSALGRASTPPWWSNALGLVGLWLGFAAAIYYAYHEGHLRALPDQWRPRLGDLVYVVLGVACQFAVDLLYAPFRLKSLDRPVHHLFNAARGPSFVLIALMTTLLAPFFEEWLFRGVLFRAIAEGATGMSSRSAVTLGVLVSAVLFGLAHGEPVQFAGLALFGVVLAVLVQRTKRLVPSFVTHVSFNAVALVALIAQRAGH
ncbi:MAG TPA: CPBP family intramembrane glutamic endopeptidase [Acidimicrobiales bacterium]|nr:CPBP family intramembrane glutamic endopeptidase [Acidimicrobiales bacterium]